MIHYAAVSSPTQNPVRRIGKWFGSHETVVLSLLTLSLFTLYLVFPTRNYYWDGITFAHSIEEAQHLASLIHPNHLIYNVVGYFFYQLLLTLGFNVRAITALQLLNAALSAIAAGVLFAVLKSTLRSLYLATFLTLLFGLSATWWKFSADADAYIISVLFLLIAFNFIRPKRTPRPLLVAMIFWLSMCFHELSVFFGPVIVLGLVFQLEKVDTKQKIFSIGQFGLLSFVLTLGTYFLCFYAATRKVDFSSFLRWISSYSPDASFTFNIWNDLGYTLKGHSRLFLSGRFNLLKGLINPFVVVLLGILLIDFLVLCYLVFRNLHRPGLGRLRVLLNDSLGRPLLLLSTSWLIIYLVFLFVWLPQNTFYRLFYLPAVIVITGLFAWARSKAAYRPTYRLALFTLAVGLANFLFFIFPYSHPAKFPPTRFAQEISNEWPPGTVIYYYLENSDKSLISYFAPSTTWIQLSEPIIDVLENDLQVANAQGRTVWLETTAIDRLMKTPQEAKWLTAHLKKDSRREVKEKGFRIEFVQVERSQ